VTHRFLAPFGIPVGDDHLRSFEREQFGDCAADPGAGPGDDGDFIRDATAAGSTNEMGFAAQGSSPRPILVSMIAIPRIAAPTRPGKRTHQSRDKTQLRPSGGRGILGHGGAPRAEFGAAQPISDERVANAPRRSDRVLIVDSHCHASDCWYEPVESLLFQMDRNGVEKAILIQMAGQSNNAYQTDCVRRFPDRLASVVNVDATRSDAPSTLARLAEEGASGVRLSPSLRSPGDDPLAIWRAAQRLGLAVSCGGPAADFASDAFVALVLALPSLRFVVEHLGSVNRPADRETEEVRRRVFGLARFNGVYIKIHGLGEFSRRALPVVQPFPFETPIAPLFDLAFEAFGPSRMMWGSDFPPVSGREGYGNALRFSLDRFGGKSEAERAAIFGETALSVFPIRGR
jgi:L-fuconolactonase